MRGVATADEAFTAEAGVYGVVLLKEWLEAVVAGVVEVASVVGWALGRGPPKVYFISSSRGGDDVVVAVWGDERLDDAVDEVAEEWAEDAGVLLEETVSCLDSCCSSCNRAAKPPSSSFLGLVARDGARLWAREEGPDA
jgi:hypothetical protein